MAESYATKRFLISLKMTRLKKLHDFQKKLTAYSPEARKAFFWIVQDFLSLEKARHNIDDMFFLFSQDSYALEKDWWEHLYDKHLTNDLLDEIINMI